MTERRPAEGSAARARRARGGPRTHLLAAVAVWFALGVSTVVVAAEPAAAATCAAPGAGQVAVVVVVDRGSGSPTQRCVLVEESRTGMHALIAAYPMRESGGFVCAIDGLPEHGCARDDATLPYWRLWRVEGSQWVYSSVGAGFYRLGTPADGSRCVVQGWSYGRSTSGAPSDAPRVPARDIRCDFPATNPRPAPRAAVPPPPVAADAAPGAATAQAPARPDRPDPEPDAPGTPDGQDPGDGAPGAEESPEPPPDGEAEEPVEDPAAVEDAAAADVGAAGEESGSEPEVLASGADAADPGPSWVGTAVVGVLIATLGAGAALQRRRRRNA